MGVRDWFTALLDGTASSGPVQPVQESAIFPGLDYADPDQDLPGDQNALRWRRLTQGQADLSPLTHERMQELALYLADRNPLAKGILDLLTAFVVADGFTVTAKDPAVQAVIDRFWEDDQNEMPARVEDMTRELALYGEQVLLAFVNAASGRVALVSADPRTVTAVRPDPLAPDRPLAVVFAGRDGAEQRVVKIITEDDDPRSPTFGRMVGQRPGDTLQLGDAVVTLYQPPELPETAGTFLAGCFYLAVNKPRAAMRGRSDLLPIADFVDLYDRLIFDEAERMSFLRAFVWDVKVTGADESTLRQRALSEAPPKPGSVKLHNESEEWTAVSPDLNADDSQTTADLILALIATGCGLPKLWLNGTMDINRATAQESADPALKRLAARQRVIRRAITRIVRFVLDQAELAGALPAAGDERHAFTVAAPEMSGRDLERASRSLLTASQALGMATAARWLDAQTAQDVLALLLAQLGLDLDLSEVRARLEQQQQQEAEDAAAEDGDEAAGSQIPAYFGLGATAGPDSLTRALSGSTPGRGAGGRGAGGERGDGPEALPPASAPVLLTPAAKDVAAVIGTLSKALVELGNARVIDGQFAQEVVTRLFAALGIEEDPVEMERRLAAEKAEAEAEDAAAAADGTATGTATRTAMDLPEDADALIDLDALALEAARQLGGGDLEAGLLRLAEAFDASLHPRDPSGRFSKKAGSEDGGAAASGGDSGDGGGGDLEARALELAREILRQQRAKRERRAKDPNAPKTPRKPRTPTLNGTELKAAIEGLQPGSSVTLTLTNGLEVSGTVEIKAGGVAMLKTADGRWAALTPQLKGLASLTTADGQSVTPGPRTPRKPRQPRQPRSSSSSSSSAAAAEG